MDERPGCVTTVPRCCGSHSCLLLAFQCMAYIVCMRTPAGSEAGTTRHKASSQTARGRCGGGSYDTVSSLGVCGHNLYMIAVNLFRRTAVGASRNMEAEDKTGQAGPVCRAYGVIYGVIVNSNYLDCLACRPLFGRRSDMPECEELLAAVEHTLNPGCHSAQPQNDAIASCREVPSGGP
jgi:hypothetical protein